MARTVACRCGAWQDHMKDRRLKEEDRVASYLYTAKMLYSEIGRFSLAVHVCFAYVFLAVWGDDSIRVFFRWLCIMFCLRSLAPGSHVIDKSCSHFQSRLRPMRSSDVCAISLAGITTCLVPKFRVIWRGTSGFLLMRMRP